MFRPRHEVPVDVYNPFRVVAVSRARKEFYRFALLLSRSLHQPMSG
jgi:hypothetical protein